MSRETPLELVADKATEVLNKHLGDTSGPQRVFYSEQEGVDFPAIVIYRGGSSTVKTLQTFKRNTEAVRVDVRAKSPKQAGQIERGLIAALKQTRRLQNELSSVTDYEPDLKVHRSIATLLIRV